jgi:hypothetical protein
MVDHRLALSVPALLGFFGNSLPGFRCNPKDGVWTVKRREELWFSRLLKTIEYHDSESASNFDPKAIKR